MSWQERSSGELAGEVVGEGAGELAGEVVGEPAGELVEEVVGVVAGELAGCTLLTKKIYKWGESGRAGERWRDNGKDATVSGMMQEASNTKRVWKDLERSRTINNTRRKRMHLTTPSFGLTTMMQRM